jgi:1-deoxy-D-xylulose-5-phosphate synthase
MPETPYLDQVQLPEDLKNRDMAFVKGVAEDVRTAVIDAVSHTGGHLGAGLAWSS